MGLAASTLPLLGLLFLAGCGSGLPAASAPAKASAIAAVNPTAVNFGTVTVGTTAVRAITVTDMSTVPLSIASVTVSDTTNFAVTSTCGTTLAAWANCALSVTFQPKSSTALSATLSLTDNADGSPQVVSLAGTGTAVHVPQASLSVQNITFADTTLGSSYGGQFVTLSNTGAVALNISSITLSNTTDFSLSSGCPAVLPASSACVISVAFGPTTLGRLHADLVFTDNGGGVAGSTQTVSLSGTGKSSISSVTNFGDSITCGYYASPNNGTGYVYSTNGYAGQLDNAIGKPAQNLCRPGDQAADMALLWVYSHTVPQLGAHQLYTAMIGTNDANACGASSGCIYNFTQSLAAALTWLALPASDKVPDSGMLRTGTWITEPDFGYGWSTTATGATLSFPVQQKMAAHDLYVAYRTWDLPLSVAGSAVVLVDGVAVGTLTASQPTGHPITTQNGTGGSVFLLNVPLGTAGQHQVTITTNGVAGARFSFLWAGVSSANYATVDGAPRVLVGGVPASTSAALNANIAVYNSAIQQLVQGLATDGLNIQIAPTATALDSSTDLVDVVHPNNAGHVKLAAAFQSVL